MLTLKTRRWVLRGLLACKGHSLIKYAQYNRSVFRNVPDLCPITLNVAHYMSHVSNLCKVGFPEPPLCPITSNLVRRMSLA